MRVKILSAWGFDPNSEDGDLNVSEETQMKKTTPQS